MEREKITTAMFSLLHLILAALCVVCKTALAGEEGVFMCDQGSE